MFAGCYGSGFLGKQSFYDYFTPHHAWSLAAKSGRLIFGFAPG
jgi:hypothetical protein